MSEFTIKVTDENGVIGITLSSPEESRPLAQLVSDELTAVLPAIVSRAAFKLSGKAKCSCPKCEQRRAEKDMPAADRVLN
ncbi:hypothetical protein [Pseudomonas sp. GZD-209]|uniref:hypothetical protein n=1 Tax=Pseudomonas sp. GZD-209 TaxID=3404807 RepID=UPI003BB79182